MAFFDKISQAGQGALQKTKDMADIARLNSSISEEEKRLNNIYFQIGKLYAQLHSSDCEESFASYINAVAESLEKIEQYRSEIQVLRAVAKCPGCGAEVPTSSRFCNICGCEMPGYMANNASQPANTVRCSNCGNFVEKNMRFCTSCGNLMTQDVPAAPVAPVVKEASVCINCGAELEADAMFCAECGTKV